MRIYCDTCIYMDLFEGRENRWLDFGDLAVSLFREVREKKYPLIISDWIIEEFSKYRKKQEIMELINGFEKDSVIKVEKTEEDKIKARRLSKINYPDALHVVLARKANAVYLVTRNMKDFAEFRDLIEITTPEMLP